ncbi:MAG: tRNA dihydrouridine synthase DusB [Nitrospirae bacterium]|nr:tRNA dihydrouridine synthase DusB [Nitrospirota bacterium]
MLKIGNLELSSNLILAPLSGISDMPFRMISRSFGCKFAFTEMISAHAIVQKSKKTEDMLLTVPEDKPLGVQLLVSEPDYIEKAIEIVNKHDFPLLDINSACPAGKVTRSGKGASMMKDPEGLRELLKIAVRNSRVPVTVKIRAGWDKDSVNARDVALHAQDAGISGLFIHGRTKKQGYSGSVDYNVIREVKEALDIPVIGSGDVFSPDLVKKMFDETGCDGVVIARGALGNPWIFREAEAFLKDGSIIERPHIDEITDAIAKHMEMLINLYGESRGVMVFRKFFAWYLKGLRNIKPLRERGFKAVTREDIVVLIEELKSSERTFHAHEQPD